MVEKLGLPFALLSDPEGELAKLYGLWNAEEGVAVPAIVVVDRDGSVRYLYEGSDFADRPGDEEVFEALDEVAGTEGSGRDGSAGPAKVRATSEEAEASSVRPDKPAMTLEALVPYYRGVFFTTVALKKRFGESGNETAFREVGNYQKMVREYAGAIRETGKRKSGS